MFFIFVTLFFLLAIGVALLLRRKRIAIGLGLVYALLFLIRIIWIIPEGQVGVTRFLGSVNEQVYPGGQGIIIINPFADRYAFEARSRLAQFVGETTLDVTLGRGSVFQMEAGVPFTFNGAYAPQMLSKTNFTTDQAASNAIRAGFRDLVQRYPLYENLSERRSLSGEYAGQDLPPIEDEIRALAQGHIDTFFFESADFERINNVPVITVGQVQIRKVTPPPSVQAAANEFEAERTALKTAATQRDRAKIEAERVQAIVPALKDIAAAIPPGESAAGFASAVNAAAQLRLTEAQAKAYSATADALSDPQRGISPTIIIATGAQGTPTPTLPLNK